MEKIDCGTEASIYQEGCHIIKLFEDKTLGEKSAEIEESVLVFLGTHSFPVPKYLGKCTIDNRAGIKMSFEEGGTLQEDFYKEGYGRLVGKILGELHYRLHQISIENELSNLPQAKNIFEQSAQKYGWSDKFTALLNTKLVVAHGDFHPANVIHVGDRHVVIDWSRAFIGPAETDIARTLVTLMLFPTPSDANDLEEMTLRENLYEAQKSYLLEYCSNVKLERSSVEFWVRLIAMGFNPKNIKKNNEIIGGNFELAWPKLT